MAPKRAAAKAPRAAAKPANNVSKNADIEDAHLQFSFGDDGPRAQAALLDWWDVGHREMPWRRELASTASVSAADREVWAYKVWVSEIMLQQTQVDRVVPYWEKWTTKWPDVASLAAASEDDVRAVWTGLGYYRRCAFLLEGAREVHASGSFPQTRDEWLKIKGVGAYTSAAISSIVFGDKTPVVDGNVIRILARLRACPELPTGRIGSKLWWLLAAEIVGVDCARPGDANQAMMEFGATLCTKANPKCNACPLQKQCRGYAEAAAAGADGAAKRVSARYPAVAEKKASVRVDAVVCVLSTAEAPGDFVLVRPSAADSVFRMGQELWELPGTRVSQPKDQGDDDADDADDAVHTDGGTALVLRRVVRDGATIVSQRRVTVRPLSHTITCSKYFVHVDHVVVARCDLVSEGFEVCVIDRVELENRGASSFVAKALDAVFKRAADSATAGAGAPKPKKPRKATAKAEPAKAEPGAD